MRPAGTSANATRYITSVTSNDSSVNVAVARILPLMIASRETGVASSGSSDCRSRSPAVASMASCMPPTKASSSRR
jgi:hypothetical protein